MGWTFPWASSFGNDFNYDFNVSFTEEQQCEGVVEYNLPARRPRDGRDTGPGARQPVRGHMRNRRAAFSRERPGMSAFVLADGVVYQTYSTYARGWTASWGMYQWLDRAPKGRNETSVWWRRHDEYERKTR